MADRTCTRCGKEFRDPSTLKRHEAKKLPCDPIVGKVESNFNCEYCNRPFASTDSRSRHIRQTCKAPKNQSGELALMQAKIAEIERKLAEQRPATMANAMGAAVAAVRGQVNGPLTQVTGALTQVTNINNVSTVNNNISVSIRPWGAALELTDGDVEAALATVPGLAGTPTLAEVVSTLMELVKRAHAPMTARNIHLNPKRADQALALTVGGWATLPLAEATGVLFDAASARMEAPAGRKAATARQERERGLRAEVPVQYRIEKETAVQLGLRPMEAHLANTRPGGPGPLLLEKAAEAGGGPPHQKLQGEADGQAGGKQSERIREAVRAHRLETRESGALEVGWILAVSKAAKVSGKELFEELKRGGEELAAAREAARIFTEEKMRPMVAPGADA